MARILIVEDEPTLAAALRQGLEDEMHVVDVHDDGESGLWAAESAPYDLILLDVLLPGLRGTEVCRRIRARGIATPILMITALDAVGDVVTGLDAGADDYIRKPFEFEELLARVRAQLRASAQRTSNVIEVDDLRIDTQAHRAWRGDEELVLTAQEMRLLEYLALHVGSVMSKTRLTEALWGFDAEPESNVLEVLVASLRKKMRPELPRLIRTYRGAGYALIGSGA